MTLAEFLLARIAEDEAVARRCNTGPPIVLALQVGMDHHEGVESGWVEVDAGRVLADCAAKRAIVQRAAGCACGDVHGGYTDEADWTLRVLSYPYRDHPDYRPEWRP